MGLIGEIRDLDTAYSAVQASLTGHLLLSTLHTNTAVGAVTRLRDMCVEPFLLSSSTLGVLAQRLVRHLCKPSKEAHPSTEKENQILGLNAAEHPLIYRAIGCAQCNHSGYKGRTGIHELLVVTDEVRELIQNGASEQVVEKVIRKTSASIRDDGLAKVLDGQTTLEEILRVTRED